MIIPPFPSTEGDTTVVCESCDGTAGESLASGKRASGTKFEGCSQRLYRARKLPQLGKTDLSGWLNTVRGGNTNADKLPRRL
jgi:hypothetical protein